MDGSYSICLSFSHQPHASLLFIAQPNSVWQSYVFGLPHWTFLLSYLYGTFPKVKNAYIFVRKVPTAIARNWPGIVGRKSCGSSISTYCSVTSKKMFNKWSSSCFNLSFNFLKLPIAILRFL